MIGASHVGEARLEVLLVSANVILVAGMTAWCAGVFAVHNNAHLVFKTGNRWTKQHAVERCGGIRWDKCSIDGGGGGGSSSNSKDEEMTKKKKTDLSLKKEIELFFPTDTSFRQQQRQPSSSSDFCPTSTRNN